MDDRDIPRSPAGAPAPTESRDPWKAQAPKSGVLHHHGLRIAFARAPRLFTLAPPLERALVLETATWRAGLG